MASMLAGPPTPTTPLPAPTAPLSWTPAAPADSSRTTRTRLARVAAVGTAVSVAAALTFGWAAATAYDGDRVRSDVEDALGDPAVQRELVAEAQRAVEDAMASAGDTEVVSVVTSAVDQVQRACTSLVGFGDRPAGSDGGGLAEGITDALGDVAGNAAVAAGDACLAVVADLEAGVGHVQARTVDAVGTAAQQALEQSQVRSAMAAGAERLHQALADDGTVVVPLEPLVRELGEFASASGDPVVAAVVELAVDRTLDSLELPSARVVLEPDGTVPWLWRSEDAVRRTTAVAVLLAVGFAATVALASRRWRPAVRRVGAGLALAAPLAALGIWGLREHATALTSPLLAAAADATLLTAVPQAAVLAGATLVIGLALVLVAGRDRRPAALLVPAVTGPPPTPRSPGDAGWPDRPPTLG